MARPWNERDGLTCLLEALNRINRSRDRQDDVIGDVVLSYVLQMSDSMAAVTNIPTAYLAS